MHLATYLGLQHAASRSLSDALRRVADGHAAEPDVRIDCLQLARWSDDHVERLAPMLQRYGEEHEDEPERLHADGLGDIRRGGVGLLRDLQDLYVLGCFVDITWTVLRQAAQAVHDEELEQLVIGCDQDTQRVLRWLRTRIQQSAPQALIASSS